MGSTPDKALRKRLRERVKHVVVDEYQDVNPIQEAVVKALSDLGAKLCVVGDDDQVLYQWRGSEVQNIFTFKERYPPVKQIRLEDNFRSSKGVVETARPFIEQNTERLSKKMVHKDAQTYEAGDIVALPFDDPDAEAHFIAATCKKLLGVAIKDGGGKKRGIAWSDMAVLLRSVARNGEPIIRALQDANTPFLVVGMKSLFRTPEADAARALFYFMAGRADCTEAIVRRAWKMAKTGAPVSKIKAAVAIAARARADMLQDVKRYSVYSPQRVFLDFLENAGIREEKVPGDPEHGQILFYNLGKFSQLISDFEAIHFHSKPSDKYYAFAKFLENQAEGAYPEGWQDSQYANPNAVRIMTVHQAKGMQWPAVFVPALMRNRFPAAAIGGRNVWHLIPESGVRGYARYRGTLEDERRLFYVAMTRAQKFLYMTWAPIEDNQRFRKPSTFWENVQKSAFVKCSLPNYSKRKRLPPQAKAGVSKVILSFSDIKYFGVDPIVWTA